MVHPSFLNWISATIFTIVYGFYHVYFSSFNQITMYITLLCAHVCFFCHSGCGLSVCLLSVITWQKLTRQEHQKHFLTLFGLIAQYKIPSIKHYKTWIKKGFHLKTYGVFIGRTIHKSTMVVLIY